MIASLRSILSVATKECLHIYRDRRIVALILLLPPLFTLLFGYAFEISELSAVPTLLHDHDQSPTSQLLIQSLSSHPTFSFHPISSTPDLLASHSPAALTIPKGWSAGLKNGSPIPLNLLHDGSDTTTAPQLEGALKKYLGDFQLASRQEIIDNLPQEVFDLGEKLPVATRKAFLSTIEPWSIHSTILFNPKLRFIEYVTPGIIGLILQLLTVTLMACTITRERESGSLSQLLVTSLRRSEIVVGKVLPYLAVSFLLILLTTAVVHFHFLVPIHQPLTLALICFLFLLCSLGLGLLISAFSLSQTQAIQFSVFFLLPVFPLSGAFAPLEQLPPAIRALSQSFPLTHFCHAFRLINLHHAPFSSITSDLLFLSGGAILTTSLAAYLLHRSKS